MLWILVLVYVLKSSEMVTPRYLAANTLSSSMLGRKCLEEMGVLSLVRCKT